MSVIQTRSGRIIDLIKPTTHDIDIDDIAHALSNLCRYTGHSRVFYSVAQHSVLVSHYIDPTYESPALNLAGLLHDAQEAYLGDMSSPLKSHNPGYKAMERVFQEVIERKFHVNLNDPRIHETDIRLLNDEIAGLMDDSHPCWDPTRKQGFGASLPYEQPGMAKLSFMYQYDYLTKAINECSR